MPPLCTAVRLPSVPQYASHLYRSTPPICTGSTFEKISGVGGSGKFLKLNTNIFLVTVVCWLPLPLQRKRHHLQDAGTPGTRASCRRLEECLGQHTCFDDLRLVTSHPGVRPIPTGCYAQRLSYRKGHIDPFFGGQACSLVHASLLFVWTHAPRPQHNQAGGCEMLAAILRADFREGDEDSNFSILRVRRFTEWPGPLY